MNAKLHIKGGHSARPYVRPSTLLDWAGPDLGLENLRQLINFYDQVMTAAIEIGIAETSDGIYTQGQSVVATLYASVSLSERG